MSGSLFNLKKHSLKHMSDFKWDDYQFHFSNTIKIPTCKQMLKEYLKGELNCEPLEFLDDIAAYKMDVISIHKKYSDEKEESTLSTPRGLDSKRKSYASMSGLSFRGASFRPKKQQQQIEAITSNSPISTPRETKETKSEAKLVSPLQLKTAAAVEETDNDFGEMIEEIGEEEDEAPIRSPVTPRTAKGNRKDVLMEEEMSPRNSPRRGDSFEKSSSFRNGSLDLEKRSFGSSSLDVKRPITLEMYKNITNEILAKARKIVDTYLADAADKEVNVSAEAKKAVKEAYTNLERQYEETIQAGEVTINMTDFRTLHFNLFSAVEQPLRVELAQDVFPRFIRSILFKVFILEQDMEFLQQIATKRDQEAIKKVFYTIDDWHNPVLTDQDIDLMHMLIQDSPDWEHVYTTRKPVIREQTSVYFNHRNFIVGESVPKILKARQLTKLVFYVPYTPLQTFESSLSLEFRYVAEDGLLEALHLEYQPSDLVNGRKYATSLNRYRFDFGGGLSKKIISHRDFYMIATCIADPKNPRNLCCIVRDASIDRKDEKNVVRGSIYLVFYYEAVGEKICRFTSIYSTNLGGYMKSMHKSVNHMLMKDIYKRRAKVMRDGLMKALKAREDAGWPPVTESMGNVEGLKENMNLYSPDALAQLDKQQQQQLQPTTTTTV
jgi:hypothetical protein